ncbi:MAG: FecR domain-containing protein [Saprospiraceae bacterium]|nr:FecR domain-containing protein [Saprospiraceae bacterium]
MNQIFDDDTLLARWLSGELTEQEKRQLEEHPDFPDFERLVSAADRLRTPDPEVPGMWNRLSQKIAFLQVAPKPQSRRKLLYWISAAAAAVLLLVFAWPFLQPGKEQPMLVSTGVGERKMVRLPDGSSVRLNAVSSISIYKDQWDHQRRIQLDGEALFEVVKNPHAPFLVESTHGTVTVLGTVFSVKTRADEYAVHCFSGRVKAEAAAAQSIILNAGQQSTALQNGQGWSPVEPVKDTLPPWTGGNSRYENARLATVLADLKIQYGVTIQANGLDDRQFTGAYPHNNLDVALKIICGALELQYEIKGKTVTILPK